MAAKTRVLVVDVGWRVGREALAADPEFELSVVESCPQALLVLERFLPAAIVVSLANAAASEAQTIITLTRACSAPLLVITKPAADQRMTALLKAGASGYLFVDDARADLPLAVRDLLRGRVPMSPPAARLVLARARRSSAQMAAVLPGSSGARTMLSGRQSEVLGLLAEGHSYEDIALALALSLNTVRTYVRAIYERLGVSTKVEAVVVATGIGLLPRPSEAAARARIPTIADRR
jgi:DNA-binding NarL/FixJ family response regulator